MAASFGVLAKFGDITTQDALVEKSIPRRKKFRSEVLLFAVQQSQPKADAAALHHAEKDLLFRP